MASSNALAYYAGVQITPLKKFLILLIIQIGLYAQAWNSQSSCNNLKVSRARKPYLRGRLGTVDLLLRLFCIKEAFISLVSKEVDLSKLVQRGQMYLQIMTKFEMFN